MTTRAEHNDHKQEWPLKRIVLVIVLPIILGLALATAFWSYYEGRFGTTEENLQKQQSFLSKVQEQYGAESAKYVNIDYMQVVIDGKTLSCKTITEQELEANVPLTCTGEIVVQANQGN